MLPPHGNEQLAHAETEQLALLYDPESEPSLQVRVWLVQLLPQATLELW
tara:strand:- start:630327 stop:630473 length:147 start_codon:yes stop_codon:yes gene_type:complete